MTGAVCRFGVLGPLVFERDGQVVPLTSARQRSLLALLLMSAGAPLSRDRLIDELWGEQAPASAISAVHVHLSKLRGLLGGLMVLEAAGYALAPADYELDVRRFDALVQEARTSPDRAGLLLREALGSVRGDPLCDVDSEGSVAEWRRELEEKRLHAILLRLDADLAGGGAGELVGELERLAAAHPFEERIWGQLMLALYRAGRQADAVEAYQRARRRFAGELGLEPGELLARLQQRILERDPALLPAAQSPAAPARPPSPQPPSPTHPPRPPTPLPRPPTPLLGRARELEALGELVSDPEVRIITLTGPGGVGKTRLGLALARSEEQHYADGAVFVRLERLTDPALVAAEIATELAQRSGADGPSADGLISYLQSRELLLVLDNFEHLLAAATLIAELVSLAPSARVLVTSRTALRIRGELTFAVEPLALPAGDGEDEIARSPAVQLFVQQATNRGSALTPQSMRQTERICRALDGLPLAIELAASRAHLVGSAQIEEQLARPLSIGEHGLRDLPDRQQTLEATIRWSYDLLSPAAREALRAAAVFLGGFTLPALEALTGAPVRAQVDELLEANLLRRHPDDGRCELLALVRAFALDELDRAEEAAATRARHRGYFRDAIAPASEAFDEGGAPGELAAPYLADHANLRAAFDDAIESGDQDCALALGLGLRPLWLAGMLRQESQELVERLLARFPIPGEREVALLRAVAFIDYRPSAKVWHRRLATRAAEIGDHDALAAATGNLFGQALNARDREEMRRLRPDLLALITPQAGPRTRGWMHYYLALDAYVEEDLDSACEHSALCVESAASAGHEVMLAEGASAQLLSRSARDGTITQPALSEALELMGRAGIAPVAVVGLWFVARYAAELAPGTAGRWLAHAERIVADLNAQLWPESVLRDETLALLGIADLAPLLAQTPALEHGAALAEAATWLAGRGPDEMATRARPEPTAV